MTYTCNVNIHVRFKSHFHNKLTSYVNTFYKYTPANAVVHTRDVIGAALHAAVSANPALVAVAHVIVVIRTALTVAVVTALLAEAEVNYNRDR